MSQTVDKVSTEKTYLQMISQDEKTKAKQELLLTAQNANLELGQHILRLKTQISSLAMKIERMKCEIPYNYKEEYGATLIKKQLEEELNFVEKVRGDRFKDATI